MVLMSNTTNRFTSIIRQRLATEKLVTLGYRSDSAVIRNLVAAGLVVHSETFEGLQAFTRIGL